MRYFRLLEDLYIPGRWYLDTPVDGHGQDSGSWLFMQGEPASVEEPLSVGLFKPGKPLDFSMADAGSVPIVHPRVASVLAELAPGDVQLFPMNVEGQPEAYRILKRHDRGEVHRRCCFGRSPTLDSKRWATRENRPVPQHHPPAYRQCARRHSEGVPHLGMERGSHRVRRPQGRAGAYGRHRHGGQRGVTVLHHRPCHHIHQEPARRGIPLSQFVFVPALRVRFLFLTCSKPNRSN
jgi:hypothetical protein